MYNIIQKVHVCVLQQVKRDNAIYETHIMKQGRRGYQINWML